jgi:FAD/FMN-containing dehydrogenase
VLPGEPGYDQARRSFNTQFNDRKPAAIAKCTRPEDVQACVEVARAARIPIAARSGGHSYAGYSTPDGGLVVDLRPLSDVRPNPDGTAVVAAGTPLIDVYSGLAAAGRCLPAGSCPTVGIAGMALGGGIGVLNRKFGLTCDRLVSATVVTADSRVVVASAQSEPDLYWALRGGGGGNFGIVTSFTFATEPAPGLTVFSLRFPSGSAADVFGAWQTWIKDAPDELWSNYVLMGGGPPSCRVGGCFIGTPGALNPLLDKLIATPVSRFVQPKQFLDAMRYFAGCSTGSVDQCGQPSQVSFAATSHMIPGPLDPARLASIVDGRAGIDILIDSFGGTISRVAPEATAFPHRTALASAQVYANTTPANHAKTAAAVTTVRDALAGLTGPAAYVNYIDPTQPDWATAYYGPNLQRLRDIARKYDPDRVFGFPQGIG